MVLRKRTQSNVPFLFLLFQANPAIEENEISPENGQMAQRRPNGTGSSPALTMALVID
jgi:hypothetical protein